ncbi:MAG: hypothetical protein GY796_24940 [Chloroflexi bacterium]|nr:hypothetical protein [Chloroflexota bacterium]
MKKITVPIIAILFLGGVLGSVALFSGNANSTLAQKPLGDEQIISAPNTEQTKEVVQTTDELAPDTKEQIENLAQEVQALNEQWTTANAKSGWVHIVSQHQEDYDEIGMLPDGKTLEKEYTNDEWYLLDERGQMIEGVFIRRDLNGNITQVSVLRDNAWYNLTYNDVISMPEEALPLDFVWNFGFPEEAIRLADSLEKYETTLDDQTVVLYTVTEKIASPMNFSDYNEAVTAIKTSAYYEPESGKMLLSEQSMIMSDGEERVRASVKLISWKTGVQPPADVLAYLDATYEGDFKHPSEVTNSPEQEATP